MFTGWFFAPGIYVQLHPDERREWRERGWTRPLGRERECRGSIRPSKQKCVNEKPGTAVRVVSVFSFIAGVNMARVFCLCFVHLLKYECEWIRERGKERGEEREKEREFEVKAGKSVCMLLLLALLTSLLLDLSQKSPDFTCISNLSSWVVIYALTIIRPHCFKKNGITKHNEKGKRPIFVFRIKRNVYWIPLGQKIGARCPSANHAQVDTSVWWHFILDSWKLPGSFFPWLYYRLLLFSSDFFSL